MQEKRGVSSNTVEQHTTRSPSLIRQPSLSMAQPTPGRELVDGRPVAGRSLVLARLGIEQFMQVFREYGSDGVNGLMPRQALPDEAIHGTADCCEAFRDLILDDRMQNGMGFQIGHLDAYGTVIVLRTLDS